MGGIYVDFSVVNQLNSPALNSNVFANRPAAGQAGRLFVSTDTFEIYRDNGTTWDLIGGPGSSTITGTGTPGTLPIFTAAQAIGDSSLLEGTTKFTTSKDFQADAIYLNGMTLGSGALYYSGNRLTLANYNVGGDVMIEANGGAFAQFISGTDLSTTFYGNIIRNGGLSTQFLKADGSLDSTAYVSNNIYIGDGTLNGARTVTLNNNILRLEGNANAANLRISADNNIARLLSFATANVQRWSLRVDGNESGSNAGANFQLRRYNDAGNFIDASLIVNRATGKKTFNATENYTTGLATGNSFGYTLNVPAGTTFSNPNSITALQASILLNLAGNATIQAGSRFGLDAYNFIGFSSTGTLTANQAGTLRAIANARTGWAFNGAATGTITHLAGLNIIRPDNTGAAMAVTNNYGILLNNQDAGIGTVTYTNRWGIYQEGASDLNYFAANVLIGSSTNNGRALQVTGEANVTSNLFVGGVGTSTRLYVESTDTLISRLVSTNASNTGEIAFITNGGIGQNIRARINAGFQSGGSDYGGFLSFYTTSNTNINNEWLRITENGNVGIGTTSPTANLEVYNATQGNIYISSAGTNASALRFFSGGNELVTLRSLGNGNFGIETGTGSPIERMRITSGGNVLVGATTDNGRRLQVNGIASFNNSSSGVGGIRIIGVGTTTGFDVQADNNNCELWNRDNGLMAFGTNGTERLKIHANGGLRFQPQSAAPTAEAGTVYYDSDDNKLKVYNGTSWIDLH